MKPSPYTTPNTTPYTTAPSTPRHFFYTTFQDDNNHDDDDEEDEDFAFDISGPLEPPSISPADELFHCGKIKISYPLSYTSCFTETCIKKDTSSYTFNQTQTTQNLHRQGNETTTDTTPFRISDVLSEEDDNIQETSLTWYNKWNLKINMMLSRNASEGSGPRRRNVVNRYSRVRNDKDVNVKTSSFRSTDSVTRKVSPHEIHYTTNRAVAEEMRRKTYLPYKSGLLGCLG